MAVTSIEKIKELNGAKEIDIPCNDGEFITLLLKRPSLLGLAMSGKIPNSLLSTVMELFGQGAGTGAGAGHKKKDKDREDFDYKELIQIVEAMCKEAVIEPPYEEIKDFLSDEQKFVIFGYTQDGVVKLERFPEEQKNNKHNKHGKDLPQKSQ